MKKFKYIFILTLALAFTLLLCSCNSFEGQLEQMSEEERGMAIAEKALLDLENVSSYRASTSANLDFNYITRIPMTITGNKVLFAKGTDNHYEYTETVVKSNTATETIIEGYSDGKMFRSDGETKVYSSLSVNEYLDHLKLINSLDDTSHLSDPTKITCKKRTNEDCYRIKVSGFDKEAIEYMCTEVLAGFPLIYKDSFAVTDIILSINVSLDFKLKEISFALEHEPLISSTIEPPVFEMSITYEEIGEVEEDSLNKVSLDDYTDALDLRLLDLAKIDAEKTLDSDCMDFSTDYTTIFTPNLSASQTYTQTYTGRLDYFKRGLEFEVSGDSGSYVYRNGKLSVNNGIGRELSEYEARETLKSILIPLSFSIDGLTTCQVEEKDNTKTYTFKCKAIEKSLTANTGLSLENESSTLTVTLTDGGVTRIFYTACCWIGVGNELLFQIDSTFKYYE